MYEAPGPSQQPTPWPPVTSAPPPRPVSSSGFTAVNSGFAAVNQPSSGFTAVNTLPPPVIKSEVNGVSSSTQSSASSLVPINGPTITTIHSNESPMPNGTPNPLKRAMSHDSLNGDSGSEGLDGDVDAANWRRSKRPKKGKSWICASPPDPANPSRWTTDYSRQSRSGNALGDSSSSFQVNTKTTR
jgi:hypothetical protein